MNKKDFIASFKFDNIIQLSNLYEKIQLATRTGNSIYTNEFYPCFIWKALEKMQQQLMVNIYSYGVFEESDRRVIAFNVDNSSYFPVNLLRISYNSKFLKLQHKDFLGALMGMGIKREKFGDLILRNDICYAPVCDDISDYIISNLQYIGKCPCKVELVYDLNKDMPTIEFREVNIITSSLRSDCVISELCNLSRNKACSLINEGKVMIDYIVSTSKDKLIKTDSIITIRGFGKFKFVKIMGTTQKDRIKAQFKKYI